MFGNNKDGFRIEPVIFTEAKTTIPGVRSEYLLVDSGVKFHFWGEPEFPKGFGDSITNALGGFPSENIIVEFVPEVDSWYGEIKNVDTLNDYLVETLVGKIAKVVESNGER